jgi:DNA adenine methylase
MEGTMNNSPTRPIVRYHGGKWAIVPWIISFIPNHKIYVELFGGGGSVLLRKTRSYTEIYNDLDEEIVNLFRVARDRGEELREKLYFTPYSRDEYLSSFQKTNDPLEKARRTVVRSFFGFGTVAVLCEEGESHPGFNGNIKVAGTSPGPTWRGYPEALTATIERLRGVVIENRDAKELITGHDSHNTVFYADPPYLPSVRDPGEDYRFEMTEREHIELAEMLNKTSGAVLVSGYHSDLYDELYKGWIRREKNTRTNMHGERTEVLWMKGVNTSMELFEGDYQ